MAFFLIGFGVGSLITGFSNYKSKTHSGFLPTKYLCGIGILALIIGLLMELQLF